jgi:HEAT repeat protein
MPHGKNILTPAATPAKEPAGRRPLLAPLLALAVLLPAAAARAQGPADPDEHALKKAGVTTDPAGLLAFFRARTPSAEDRRQIEELVGRLDSKSFQEREQAAARLIKLGHVALPALKRATTGTTLEHSRRAQEVMGKIERGPGPELPAAAARLLAARQSAGAVGVLLDYLPFVEDETLEEEVLSALGALGARQGKADPLLVAGLSAPEPVRRAAAAYVLAQDGGLGQRAAVRKLLADPDVRVRTYAAAGLVGKAAWQALQENPQADEAVVRGNNVPASGPGLLEYLRKNSPGAAEQARLRQLVRQLGARAHRQREAASAQLAREGPAALSFLKEALGDRDAEIARRAALCIDRIKRGPGPALPAAAVRLLARQAPAGAVAALLNYRPFADDEMVQGEVLTALCLLSVREPQVDPLLVRALHDPEPSRRGAAAYVLGRVGTRADCADLPRLLTDAAPRVRFRAAQALLTAGDAAAVPELIRLAGEAPPSWAGQVDELLLRLAGGRPPDYLQPEEGPGARQKVAAAWARWWREQKGAVNFARLAAREQYLGLAVICEYDNQTGRLGGRVWETGHDGRPRWELRGLLGPMDAQVLPGGRVLVAENMANRVTERDLSGAVKWEYRTANNPIACQRLANGNTFVATYTQVMEVTPAGQVVHVYGNGPGFYIFSARRLRNGHVLCMTAQGLILEVDPAAGREVRRVQVPGPFGGWCSAEALPNGHYLVALQSRGRLLEVDATGKSYWEASYPGAFRATRLPTGGTLVASMTTRRVAELDRSGAVRWEAPCEGRPWQARYR